MRNETSYGNGLFSIIKAVGLALAFSFLAVLIFAGALRCTKISDSAIYPVNQTIKVFAIAIGTLLFVSGEKGWLKGMAVGGLFTAVSYLTFSVVGGDFSLSWLILLELLLGLIAGALSGIIAVNVKR